MTNYCKIEIEINREGKRGGIQTHDLLISRRVLYDCATATAQEGVNMTGKVSKMLI